LQVQAGLIHRLQAQVTDLEAQAGLVPGLQAQVTDLEAQAVLVPGLRAQVADLQAQVEQRQTLIEELQAEHLNCSTQVAELEAENCSTQVAELEAEHLNCSTQIAELEAEHLNCSTQVAELEAEAQRSSSEIALISQTAADLQGQVNNLTAQVATIPARPSLSSSWVQIALGVLPNVKVYRKTITGTVEHPMGLLNEAECRAVAASTPCSSIMSSAMCDEHGAGGAEFDGGTRFQDGGGMDPWGCFILEPFGFYYNRRTPSGMAISAGWPGPSAHLRKPVLKLEEEEVCLTWSSDGCDTR